jgi:predicted Zn-dependent protease
MYQSMNVITTPPTSRFLSQAECAALAKRAASFAMGGGDTGIRIESSWTGNLRYARNAITTSGDVRNNAVSVLRDINGASGFMQCNQIADSGLQAAIRRAEHVLRIRPETGGTEFQEHFILPNDGSIRSATDVARFIAESDRLAALKSLVQVREEYAKPKIFFDDTYTLDADHRADTVIHLLDLAKKQGLVAAGYVEVSARGRAVIDTWGRSLYYPYTLAQFSVTVRDPDGTGSGWAGVDWNDWTRIDPAALSAIAIDKCQRSRNPVAIEPGRYTVILEPQAVCDLVYPGLIRNLERAVAESGAGPWAAPKKGQSKIGQRVIDPRISISADPMDPDLGFPPFSQGGNVYHPVTWIEHGVLKELAYFRPYGIRELGKNTGLPNSTAFRMSGGTTTIDQMIASTTRGVLVTRFFGTAVIDLNSAMMTGYTRDGLWLIEHGRIVKPVKNFRFRDSPLFMLNNVEALGVPTRVFHPGAPAVVPPIKARDFNFASLSDAI